MRCKKHTTLLADTASGNFPSAFWYVSKIPKRSSGFFNFFLPALFAGVSRLVVHVRPALTKGVRAMLLRGVHSCVNRVFVSALRCAHFVSSFLTFFSSDSSLTNTDARRSSSMRSQMRRDAEESRFFASACVHASKSAGIDTDVLVILFLR